MRQDHITKAQAVLARTQATVDNLVRQGGGGEEAVRGALLGATEEGSRLWEAAFPKGSGKIDLSGGEFRGSLFTGAHFFGLENANLQGANLELSRWMFISSRNVNFARANLAGARFVDISMNGANFQHANLSGSNFRPYLKKDWGGPLDLRHANLRGAYLVVTLEAEILVEGADFQDCTVAPESLEARAGFDAFVASLSSAQRAAIKTEIPPPAPARSGCFIATAACGSESAPEVRELRAFRDRVLARSIVGRSFIRSYVLLSPPIASFIGPRPSARRWVRSYFVRPLAFLARKIMQS